MAQQNTLALGENSANPQVFNFDNLPVRTVDRDGAVWFVANDVCTILDIANPRNIIARLDEDEKDVHNLDTLGGRQETSIISESGLYALVMTSRKPQAKRFKKWVTAEVLPAIRKTGAYMPETPEIDHRGRPRLEPLANPNYQLASEVAAKAAQAVFEALLIHGERWLRNQRLLLSMQQANKYKPIVKPVAPDAYVASLVDLIRMIEGNAPQSLKELIDLASACNAGIAKRMS